MFFLVSLIASATILRTDLEDALEKSSKYGRHFVLLANSETFQYPGMVGAFTRAAHLVKMECNYYIVDLSGWDVAPENFNVSVLPAILFRYNGETIRSHTYGFEQDEILGFFQQGCFPPIPFLGSISALEEFKCTAALGFICAIERPSEEMIACFDKINMDHFNEITVALANPELFEAPGFYVYRFLDHHLAKVELENFDPMYVLEQIVPLTSATFLHHDYDIERFFQDEKTVYAFLSLPTEGFYVNEETADEINYIKEKCNMNVSFAIAGKGNAQQYFGFPKSKSPQMAIIDHRGHHTRKYLMEGDLSRESIAEFCESFEAGTAKRVFKSGVSKQVSGSLEEITANTLKAEISSNDLLVIGLYHMDNACLEPLKNLSAKMTAIRFGEYSIADNDWAGEDTVKLTPLPRLLVYRKGRLTHAEQMGNTTAAIREEINAALAADRAREKMEAQAARDAEIDSARGEDTRAPLISSSDSDEMEIEKEL